jgi:hypothetical protein
MTTIAEEGRMNRHIQQVTPGSVPTQLRVAAFQALRPKVIDLHPW